jgi:hypothetical protein
MSKISINEMKRDKQVFIITCLLSLIIFSDLQAQFGVKIGVSVSALLSSNADDFRPFLGHKVEWIQYGESRPVLGIQFGAYYDIKLSDYFDLQPEINFIQRGYWFDQTPLYDTRYKIKINYLELPLIIKYKAPVNFININVHTGPFAAIKLNATGHLEYEGIQKIESLDCVKDFDYGMVMGLGSEFKVGTGQMLIDLKFNWGLHNMMSQPDDYIDLYEDPGRVRNLSLILLTGYRFGSSNQARK